MPPSYGPNNTDRFTTRAHIYHTSRPWFPDSVVDLLLTQFPPPATGLMTIADVGSGTGISSLLFLESPLLKGQSSGGGGSDSGNDASNRGNTTSRASTASTNNTASPPSRKIEIKISGVEPNDAMRHAAESLLATHLQAGTFVSVAGTAEATSLEPQSVDLAISAQAFHWFDVPKTRAEFQRIVKSAGGVAILWNDRRGIAQSKWEKKPEETQYGAFMDAYETMLWRWSKDYQVVNHHAQVDEGNLKEFFGPAGFQKWVVPNPYYYDWEELKGRLLSSSYAPEEGEEGHEGMMGELREIFDKHKNGDGRVEFVYDTRVFYGKLS